MTATEMEVLLCKTLKNPEADGDRRLRSDKLKRNGITITETTKKTETLYKPCIKSLISVFLTKLVYHSALLSF